MSVEVELFQQGKYQELWQRCCGFIDLSIEDFMKVQKRLLIEQMELLKKCELGQRIMNGARPESIEEFRELVPLTTYADYAPYLLKRRMDILPRKPILWQCTSGKSGEYPFRWAPVTARQLDEIEQIIFAMMFFSSCKEKGAVNLRRNDRVLYGMAPPPYTTGTMTRVFPNELFTLLPPIEDSEVMTFEERIQRGFEMALSQGLDMSVAMSSVAVAIGERFSRRGKSKMSIKSLLNNPKATLRLIKGLAKSKLARRPLLPKDLWTVQGIVCGGSDGSILKKRVEELWDRRPLQHYASCEGGHCALQTWDFEGMTFVPNLNFFEFIPEREHFKWQLSHSYQPKTVLLDEVRAGENYEIVLTNFHGGAFVRYRIGDIIRITSLRNERLNIDIPQMVFYSRADDRIDISGFGRLTERVIWEAIENSGISYKDWTARKEIYTDMTLLRLYLELGDNYAASEDAVATTIYGELQKLDSVYHYNHYGAYSDPETILGLKPIKVTFLRQGAFARYIAQRQAEGADLGSIKPPHINPSDKVLSLLGAPEIVVEPVPATEAEHAAA